MKKDITLSGIIKPLIKYIKRSHTIIFFLVVSAGLFTAIAILLPITSLSSDTGQEPSPTVTTPTTFDQETIDRLRNTSSSSTDPAPGQRKNPFIEE